MYELGNKMAPVLQLGEELVAMAPPPPQPLKAAPPGAPVGKAESSSSSGSTGGWSASNATTTGRKTGEGEVLSSTGSEDTTTNSGPLLRI